MIYGYLSHLIISLLPRSPFQQSNISRYDATYATEPRYSGKISDTTCRDKGGASRAQCHLLMGVLLINLRPKVCMRRFLKTGLSTVDLRHTA